MACRRSDTVSPLPTKPASAGARNAGRQRVAAGDASGIVHGTWAAYLTDKCRCAECRAMKSAYMKQYRSKKKKLTQASPGQATL
jgi:hypothetical protein